MPRCEAPRRPRDGSSFPSAAAKALMLTLGCWTFVGCQWSMQRPSLPAPPLKSAPSSMGPASMASESSGPEDFEDGSPLRAAVKKQPRINDLGPEVMITDLVGTNMGAAGAMLAPSISEVERCAAPVGTVLKLRLYASQDRKTVQIDRSSTVSGDVGRCVVEALSRMSVNRTLQQSGSPSERGPIIEGLLVFSW